MSEHRLKVCFSRPPVILCDVENSAMEMGNRYKTDYCPLCGREVDLT